MRMWKFDYAKVFGADATVAGELMGYVRFLGIFAIAMVCVAVAIFHVAFPGLVASWAARRDD
jgi:hypothetical protein